MCMFVKVCYCGDMNLCSKHDNEEQKVQSTVNIYHMTKVLQKLHTCSVLTFSYKK